MIEFNSDKAAPMLMLDEPARWILQALGVTGKVPSALAKEEIPNYVVKLKSALHELKLQEAIDLRIQSLDNIDEISDEDLEDDLEAANTSGEVLMSHRVTVFLDLLEEIEKKQGYLMWKHA